MTKLRVALQMNALEDLNLSSDSTLYLARAAASRGYELFHYQPQNLALETGRKGVLVTAHGHRLSFAGDHQTTAQLSHPAKKSLLDFDVLLMRQDPPFDLAYIAATHMLEHIKDKIRIINDPVSVRNAPEKLLSVHFPHLMPPTLISRDRQAIAAFAEKHGDVVFKPLFGYAGYGIFRLRKDDGNMPALLETMAAINPEPWMVQKYLKEITTAGDKRIIMLAGEPVGCFTRIPGKNDIRGNMRVGAKPKAAKLTERDKVITAELGPLFRAQGLYFVGIDVIGDFLTEINVTSPTGLLMADQLEKRRGAQSLKELFWDRLPQ